MLIQDIVAIHGPRLPPAAESPRVHRQAFIFIVGAGRTASDAQVAKVDRIRRAWETFFVEATERPDAGRDDAALAVRLFPRRFRGLS